MEGGVCPTSSTIASKYFTPVSYTQAILVLEVVPSMQRRHTPHKVSRACLLMIAVAYSFHILYGHTRWGQSYCLCASIVDIVVDVKPGFYFARFASHTILSPYLSKNYQVHMFPYTFLGIVYQLASSTDQLYRWQQLLYGISSSLLSAFCLFCNSLDSQALVGISHFCYEIYVYIIDSILWAIFKRAYLLCTIDSRHYRDMNRISICHRLMIRHVRLIIIYTVQYATAQLTRPHLIRCYTRRLMSPLLFIPWYRQFRGYKLF